MRSDRKKIKIISTVTAVVFAAVLVMTSVLAYFKYETESDSPVTTMKTDIELVETPLEGDETGLKYQVQPTDENTDYIYTRVVIFPIIEIQHEANNDHLWDAYAGIPSSNINYEVVGDDWKYANGYYYYQWQINSGDNVKDEKNRYTTPIHIKDISLTTSAKDEGSGEIISLPTSVDGRQIRVRFYVSAEAVQAKNEEYKLNWDLDKSTFTGTGNGQCGIKDLYTIYENKSDTIAAKATNTP